MFQEEFGVWVFEYIPTGGVFVMYNVHTLEGEKKTCFHKLLCGGRLRVWGGGEDSPLHPPVDETLPDNPCYVRLVAKDFILYQ